VPRYFIHIQNGVYVADNDGSEMFDLAAARSAMVRAAGSILTSDLHAGKSSANFTLFLDDENSNELLRLKVSATLQGKLAGQPSPKHIGGSRKPVGYNGASIGKVLPFVLRKSSRDPPGRDEDSVG